MAEGSEKGDSAERLVVFTDAVVAIALTLLVLPLVDLVWSGAGGHVGRSASPTPATATASGTPAVLSRLDADVPVG